MRPRLLDLGTAALLPLLPLLACSASRTQGGAPMSLAITSSAFAPNGAIPPRFTCEGADVSPPLEWTGVPTGARSLALIVDDPDAPDPRKPTTTWVHWVTYDIPATAPGIPENAGKQGIPGARPGLNDWKRPAWGGPCPPIGRHRYFFKLYALDTQLGDLHQPTKARLEQAMHGHVLAQGELIGTYQKAR